MRNRMSPPKLIALLLASTTIMSPAANAEPVC
jgi:hypothetical protein